MKLPTVIICSLNSCDSAYVYLFPGVLDPTCFTTKIVVVDDNANNLLLEKDLLLMANFKVFTAMNAKDALLTIRREIPEVIILDVQLPDMSGTEIAKIL